MGFVILSRSKNLLQLSKSTYWVQLEKKTIEEFYNIVSSHLQLPIDVPTLSKYIQTWKFAPFN